MGRKLLPPIQNFRIERYIATFSTAKHPAMTSGFRVIPVLSMAPPLLVAYPGDDDLPSFRELDDGMNQVFVFLDFFRDRFDGQRIVDEKRHGFPALDFADLLENAHENEGADFLDQVDGSVAHGMRSPSLIDR
jgi:hypothetical protein